MIGIFSLCSLPIILFLVGIKLELLMDLYSLTSILAKGDISIKKHALLSSILHVSNLSNNFLSGLTKHLNFSVTFCSSHSVFQDLETRRMFGGGHEIASLYLLDNNQASLALQTSRSNFINNKNVTKIRLWHVRLQHLSFRSLNVLFPNSFKSVSQESVPIGRILQIKLQVQTNRSFDIIFVVWGASRCNSVDGFPYFLTFVDDFSRITWLYLMKSMKRFLALFAKFSSNDSNQIMPKNLLKIN